MVPDKDIGDPSDRVEEELATIIPRDRRQPYDMRKLIALVVDHDSFSEMGRKYGPGQIIGFARMNGQSVGIFGNDCRYYAGSMTAAGAQKVRKFVETCETFHIPIIALVDEPGFMIGSEAEKAGTIKYGTAAVLAVADNVPWASVVIKKSYGVAAAAHTATTRTNYSGLRRRWVHCRWKAAWRLHLDGKLPQRRTQKQNEKNLKI